VSFLGTIPRSYEITPPRRTKAEFNEWEAERPTKAMLPDCDGLLDIIADCGYHMTKIPQNQIGISQPIPCPKGCR
jgi:hypothetical protein